MPIYEFYCAGCHTMFNFFSSRINTDTTPACPRDDQHELERRPARFATVKRLGSSEEDEDNPFPGLDEQRLESALESLGGEMDGLGDDEDPRQMARFFRRFGDVAGIQLGPRMEEMLHRLEAGEDPDSLEDEMGDEMDDEDGLEDWMQFKHTVKSGRGRRLRRDETLYFM